MIKKDIIFNKLIKKTNIKNKHLFKLLLIRSCELAFIELAKKGKIRGPLHTSVGQEVVAVSICDNLKFEDALFSTHRGHGHYIAKGGNLTKLILELAGDKRGCCKGLGGSMHVAQIEKNIMGSNGIVGAGVPIACGFAFSQKIKKKNSIATVFFGDGAMNQGVVMESLNLAAIYDLPVLFVCENNYYAYSTKSSDMSKTKLFNRAKGFGIKSKLIDGMNFNKSFLESQKAINYVRKFKSPFFLEFSTYRFHRHFANERARDFDYLDFKTEKKMFNKDPCIVECKKSGIDNKKAKTLIQNFKNIIIEESIKII